MRNLALPGLLGVFGRGYAEIFGASLLGTRCDDHLCRAPSAPYVSIIYTLPKWVAMRIILLRYNGSPLSGPEFVLRVARVVRERTAGFRAIYSGDLDAFKRAIASGDNTPYDVEDGGYWSLSLLEASDKI